jgi:hypothetical protein
MTTRLHNLNIPFTFRFDVTTSGTPEQLRVKRRAATIAFVAASAGNSPAITDSGNLFLVAGFEVGDQIVVTGATNGANNATFEVIAVVAGTLTLHSRHAATIVTEGAAATVTIVAGKAVPDGISVAIKAFNANGGVISLSNSSARALNTAASSFRLRNNESIDLQVNNTENAWIDSSVSGESVEVSFEKNIAPTV